MTHLPLRPRSPDTPETTGIAARVRRAERMNLEPLAKIYKKSIKDMTTTESELFEFFLRYHPAPFDVLDAYVQRDVIPRRFRSAI